MYVGGGLGAVPQEARLYSDFVPEEELLPVSQAIARVFARLGEKRSRAKVRIKFLVQKLGVEEFRALVREERANLRHDPRWTAYLSDLDVVTERPIREPGRAPSGPFPEGFEAWRASNVRPRRQAGYVVATLAVPLGRPTARQARGVAVLAREVTGAAVRNSVEQSLLLRWVAEQDVVALYEGLAELGRGAAGANTTV